MLAELWETGTPHGWSPSHLHQHSQVLEISNPEVPAADSWARGDGIKEEGEAPEKSGLQNLSQTAKQQNEPSHS